MLLAAVAVMATVATTLTALVPVYSTSVVDAGFRQAIDQADPAERTVSMTLRADSGDAGAFAVRAIEAGDEVLGGAASGVVLAESGAYQFVGRDSSTITALATEYGETMFDVVASTEPRDGGAQPARLHVDAAAALGLALGDVVEIETREAVERVEVVALVEPTDTTDPRWIGTPFGRDGVRTSATFTEIGPFFLDADRFEQRSETVTLRGRFALAGDRVSVDDLDEVVAGVESARDTFATRLDSSEVRIDTALDELLGSIDTAVRSTGAVVGVILLQLVAVALYGLGVSAAVLARSRDDETVILRARGASTRQLALATMVESTIVVVPAVLIGPPLAVLVVDWIGTWGPIEATGLRLSGRISPVAVIVAFLVAAVAVAVVTAATVSAAGRRDESARDRSFLHRNGLDLVLFVIAVLGLWQLGRAGTVATQATPDGRATIDPILALAPTLGVVAASLLTVRLLMVAARVLLRSGTRSRGLVPALAGWDMVRRPARQARTAVLIVVAVSIGVFGAVHADSWQRSQQDQANAATGSDVTVVPDLRPNADVPTRELPAAYRAIEGVDAVLPIEVRSADFGGDLTSVTLVAADVSRLNSFLRMRDDLRPPAAALAQLGVPVDTGGAALPDVGELTATVTIDGTPDGAGATAELDVALIVRDEFGTSERLDVRLLADGAATQTVFGSIPERTDGAPSSLVGVEVTAPVPDVPIGTPADEFPPLPVYDITVADLMVGDTPVDTSAAVWLRREVTTDRSTTSAGTASAESRPDGVDVSFEAGTNRRPNMRAIARFTTAEIEEDAVPQGVRAIDVLATPALLGRTQLAIGDEAMVRLGGLRVVARIAGTTPVVPYAADDRLALLVDRPSLTSVEFTTLGASRPPDMWAVIADEANHSTVTATLGAAPFNSVVVADRRLDAERRSRDPVLVGLTGSLFAAVLAATVVVVLGLLLTAFTESRERRSGYAVLSALGVSRAQLRRLLVRETVPLAVLATACGVAAGMILANLTVGSLTTGGNGSAALPVPELVVPWPTIVGLVLLTLAAVFALPLLTSRLLQQVRPADELRIGDQR